MPSAWHALLIIVFAFELLRVYEALSRLLSRSRARKRRYVRSLRRIEVQSEARSAVAPAVPDRTREDADVLETMQAHKELYFKVQNLEDFPEILPQARDVLIQLLSETLANAQSRLEPDGILSIGHYGRVALENFIRARDEDIARQWERYVARRAAGSPMELFGNRQEAESWLKQSAPVRYVDGAWLGHIHKITTPFSLRYITKNAWQVVLEELGDGDLEKNHVQVYRELMKEIDAGLPDANSADFVHARHQLNEPHIWKAALAQLLISLFPHEFLPEILGFNMHFEMLTLNTMKATKELEEVKLNPYYFILHISIDNADSGHSAMAMQVVMDYIEHVRRTDGESAVQQVWKRVQTGFILSEGLSASPVSPSIGQESAVNSFPRTKREAEVIAVFRAKASVAHRLHCGSRMRIGRRSLVDWLEPRAFESKQWQMDFLSNLSNTKAWVCKGDSSKGKLIQELSWGGKIFGSFTQNEVEVIKRWIDSLGKPDPRLYWSFVGRTEVKSEEMIRNQDIRVDYPVLSPLSSSSVLTMVDDSFSVSQQPTPGLPNFSLSSPLPANLLRSLTTTTAIRITTAPNLSKLLPYWFTHPCLLESFICIPAKTTTVFACALVRLLRAQSGFAPEGPGVAGMDEVRRTSSSSSNSSNSVVGLVELGLEMAQRARLPAPGCLKDVLQEGDWEASAFAVEMLQLSMRPVRDAALSLGLARAFVGLHEAVAVSSSSLLSASLGEEQEPASLLSAASREVLGQMARRERECMDVCIEQLSHDEDTYEEFWKGYELGRAKIENCFLGHRGRVSI